MTRTRRLGVELIHRGVPTEAIPTYCALSDYANNKTGLAWPKMETLAETLGRSVRTIQRHLHLLKKSRVFFEAHLARREQ